MIMQIRYQREFLRKRGVKEDLLKLRETRKSPKSETQTRDVFGLRLQVNIQTILDRIQEIRQNVAKQELRITNKQKQIQTQQNRYKDIVLQNEHKSLQQPKINMFT